MVEPGTGLSIAGLLFLSKETINKLLGPTADYLGDELLEWAKKRHENLSRIFSKAAKKLGEKIDERGTVPPKVLKGILNEGSFCDDPLATEYFGGVLASSRSEVSRDDRGGSFLAMISRLSTYQIRTHYILYRILKNLYDGTNISLSTNIVKAFLPATVYISAMDFGNKENSEILSYHALVGLHKEGLIVDYTIGSKSYLNNKGYLVNSAGIVFVPTPLGVELFFWAHGKQDLPIKDFLNSANKFEIEEEINIPQGYQIIKSM
jgi:hypothetical protein